MKRFHVHAHVDDLPTSIAFYSKMFAADSTTVAVPVDAATSCCRAKP